MLLGGPTVFGDLAVLCGVGTGGAAGRGVRNEMEVRGATECTWGSVTVCKRCCDDAGSTRGNWRPVCKLCCGDSMCVGGKEFIALNSPWYLLPPRSSWW